MMLWKRREEGGPGGSLLSPFRKEIVSYGGIN